MAVRLTTMLFDVRGDLDDKSLASRHAIRFEPDERDKMVAMYSSGRTLQEISAEFRRTPLAVSWQLLDSPRRPVRITSKLRRSLKG